MWDSKFFFPHRVTIRPKLGDGAYGAQFGSPVEIAAEVLDQQRLVRTADGAEVVSSTRVTVHQAVPVGSMVTVWKGETDEREAEVLTVGTDRNDPPLPVFTVLHLA